MAKREPTPPAKRRRGRPLSGDKPRKSIEVTLPPTLIEQFRELGEGNVSRGIERAGEKVFASGGSR